MILLIFPQPILSPPWAKVLPGPGKVYSPMILMSTRLGRRPSNSP